MYLCVGEGEGERDGGQNWSVGGCVEGGCGFGTRSELGISWLFFLAYYDCGLFFDVLVLVFVMDLALTFLLNSPKVEKWKIHR